MSWKIEIAVEDEDGFVHQLTPRQKPTRLTHIWDIVSALLTRGFRRGEIRSITLVTTKEVDNER